jgi:hypothetical protein
MLRQRLHCHALAAAVEVEIHSVLNIRRRRAAHWMVVVEFVRIC